jgi:hypothetical protein
VDRAFPQIGARKMMDYEVNPFQVLYVTDSPDPRVFVKLFSDFPIKHAQAMFRQGNAVIRGTQGAGKSMLLNLLRPQIRFAYYQANTPFPVPKPLDKFIGAGINLTRSGILDIGQRPLSADRHSDETIFPLYFADFLNYYTVRDILSSLGLMRQKPEAFGALVQEGALDAFARRLASEDCWFGFLDGCDSFMSLGKLIDDRISAYRAFHQYNTPALAPAIQSSKTAIGEPIARVEACLKETGVVPPDVPLFVRIDQVERLFGSDVLRPDLGVQYRRIINKALSLRDSRVSYCIGVRTYAWEADLTIFGTDDKLENIRDFRIIDLDELLRRREDQKTWIFPSFAEDVFVRRLQHAGYAGTATKDAIKSIFGSTRMSEDASEIARQYARNSDPQRALSWGDGWPDSWNSFLGGLFAEDPLEACLACAWAHQRGRSGKRGARLSSPPPVDRAPWKKLYWRKDRVRLCLLQLAARTAQRYKWAGKEAILALSSGNISVFVSICHEIWDAFLRAERRKPNDQRANAALGGIVPEVQAVAIQTASAVWHEKITEQPNGDDRQRFVDVLGRIFRGWLIADHSLSYPGHNGFSLANEDLLANPAIRRFLSEAVDYGDLYEAAHTTKEKDRRPRTKWYLPPILSDYFQIPEVHTREPYYASVEEVIRWLREAQVILKGVDYSILDKRRTISAAKEEVFPLFSNLEKE